MTCSSPVTQNTLNSMPNCLYRRGARWEVSQWETLSYKSSSELQYLSGLGTCCLLGYLKVWAFVSVQTQKQQLFFYHSQSTKIWEVWVSLKPFSNLRGFEWKDTHSRTVRKARPWDELWWLLPGVHHCTERVQAALLEREHKQEVAWLPNHTRKIPLAGEFESGLRIGSHA